MGKTATLNIRVNPDVKENAESVLAQLGIPMATLRFMLMSRWRAIHPVRKSADCEQAPMADFVLPVHRL